MRRLLLPGISALLALALVALLIFGVLQTNSSHTSIDDAIARGSHPRAPDATLPTLDGGTRRLADFRGKLVVVNFFAHWCGPCKAEAPLLARTQTQISRHGATIVGIAWDDTVDDARAFVRAHGVNYPVLRDVDGTFGTAYGVQGMPETFVLDRTGHIVALRRGPLDARWIASTLDPLLTSS